MKFKIDESKTGKFLVRGYIRFLPFIVLLILLGGLLAAVLVARQQSFKRSSAAAAPVPSSFNLLVNGNFSQGLSGWDKIKNVDYERGNTVTDQRIRGNVSAKLTSRAIGAGIGQKLILPAQAASYTFSGYYKPVKNIAVATMSLDVVGKTTQQYVIPLTISDDGAHPGWKFFTGPITLSWQNYASLYSDSANGFVTNLKVTFPAVDQVILLDDFKIAVDDGANIIQNPNFDGWKDVSNLYAWGESQSTISKTAGPAGVSAVSVKAAAQANLNRGRIAQDISKLAVLGGDYDLSVQVKGGFGWVSVSSKLPSGVTGGAAGGLYPGKVYAADVQALDSAPADRGNNIDGKYSCFNVTDSGGSSKVCRLYFSPKTDWTTVGHLFHVDEKAINTFVYLNAWQKSGGLDTVSFANVSLTYHQAQVSGAPTLVSPANGTTTPDPTPRLSWQRLGGFGNSGVTKYVLEVANNSDTGSDGGFSKTVFLAQVANNQGTNIVARNTSQLADGTYYWHALAVNDSGQKSLWSEVWSFTVDTKRPSVAKTQITVVLGSNPKTGQVVVSWPAQKDPRQDSSFDHFEYAVKDSNGKVLSQGRAVLAEGVYSYTMPMLANLENGDYFSEWTIVDRAGNRRTERKGFGYFEDGFGKLDSGVWEVKPGLYGSINALNNMLVMSESGAKKYSEVGAFLNLPRLNQGKGISGSYDLEIQLNNPSSEQKDFGKFGMQIFSGGGSGPFVGLEYIVSSSRTFISFNGLNIPAVEQDVSSSIFPAVLEFRSDGAKVTPKLNGADFSSAVSLANLQSVEVRVLSDLPSFPNVSASFDNFRLIWVK